MGKQQLAKAAAAVVANRANDEKQRTQMTTIIVQLDKIEDDVETANDTLETLRTNKEAKKAEADDPENIDWLRNIELRTDNNATTAATFKKEILQKLNSIPEAEWKVYTNGSSCNGKGYAIAMIHLATYINQKFTLLQYGCLLGVKPGHHNVDITMKKLVQLRIMRGSLDKQGLTVYGLVDTLRIHIQYDEDDSLKDELNRLFTEENAAIEARSLKKSKRKNASNGGKKRSQPKQQTNNDTEDTDEGNSESDEVDDKSETAEN